jgi:hypothetical protein
MEPASRRQQLVHGRTDATPDAAEAVLDACEADEAEEAEETGSSDLFGSDSDDSDAVAGALSAFAAAAAATIIVESHSSGDESQPEAGATGLEAEQGSTARPNCLVWRSEVMAFMLRFLARNYGREPTAFPKKLLGALEEGYAKHQSRKARDRHCEAAERGVAVQLCAQYASDRIQPGRSRVNFRGITGRASERGPGGGGGGGCAGEGESSASRWADLVARRAARTGRQCALPCRSHRGSARRWVAP